MIRTVTVAALLVAGVAVVHAQNVQITTVDQCNQTVTTLEDLIKNSLASDSALDQAKAAVDKLKAACTAGDFTAASNAATGARTILAVE